MALQFDALATAGCAQIFQDTASGAKADQPGQTASLSYARNGDILVVWKLDRLGRPLPHLLETVTNLEKRGIGFRGFVTATVARRGLPGKMADAISFARHQFPPEIIRHAVWLYVRFTLSYRDVEDLLAERGLDVSYETVRRWVLKFGPLFARELHRRRPRPTSQ